MRQTRRTEEEIKPLAKSMLESSLATNIFNKAPVPMLLIDNRASIEDMNLKCLSLFGIEDYSQIIGNSLYKYLRPAYRADFLTLINKINDEILLEDTTPYRLDVEIVNKDNYLYRLVLTPYEAKGILVMILKMNVTVSSKSITPVEVWINRQVALNQFEISSNALSKIQEGKTDRATDALVRSKELADEFLNFQEIYQQGLEAKADLNGLLADFRERLTSISDHNIKWIVDHEKQVQVKGNNFIIDQILLALFSTINKTKLHQIEVIVKEEELPPNAHNIDTQNHDYVRIILMVTKSDDADNGNNTPVEDIFASYHDIDMIKYAIESTGGFFFVINDDSGIAGYEIILEKFQ